MKNVLSLNSIRVVIISLVASCGLACNASNTVAATCNLYLLEDTATADHIVRFAPTDKEHSPGITLEENNKMYFQYYNKSTGEVEEYLLTDSAKDAILKKLGDWKSLVNRGITAVDEGICDLIKSQVNNTLLITSVGRATLSPLSLGTRAGNAFSSKFLHTKQPDVPINLNTISDMACEGVGALAISPLALVLSPFTGMYGYLSGRSKQLTHSDLFGP